MDSDFGRRCSCRKQMEKRPKCQEKQYMQVRVLCLRLRSFPVANIPEVLSLLYCPSTSKFLREERRFSMRRDRVDKQFQEVSYVSTDCVLVEEDASFEVYWNEDEALLRGRLWRFREDWKWDCNVGSGFPGKEKTPCRNGFPSSMLEFSVAGSWAGNPVFLMKRVRLFLGNFDEKWHEDQVNCREVSQNGDHQLNELIANESLHGDQILDTELEFKKRWLHEREKEEEKDEIWFNAGVKAGVGIGLGLSISIGLGLGLLVSTYRFTSDVFRRRFS